jgi:hypothetical protein
VVHPLVKDGSRLRNVLCTLDIKYSYSAGRTECELKAMEAIDTLYGNLAQYTLFMSYVTTVHTYLVAEQ